MPIDKCRPACQIGSRPTRSYSPQEEQKREQALTQPLLFLSHCSSTTWLWTWTAFSFIAAGPLRGRMAILSISFGIIQYITLCKNHGNDEVQEKTNRKNTVRKSP